MQDSSNNVLTVSNLSISFGEIPVVRDVSFALQRGATMALVGESGSGKSLTALSVMGLLPPSAKLSGSLQLNTSQGQYDLLDNEHLQTLRGKDIGMVFQEPMSSLNPVMTIGRQITESILLHSEANEKQAKEITINWLRKVQLPAPEEIYNRYPHQLSGGQKQRVMIAMAMCNNPALLIADEPTTALDVTVQKEVIELMAGLKKEFGTAMIFITHDLALAARIADTVTVMQHGSIVEHGAAKQVLTAPQHPYTQALLACRPSADDKGKRLPIVADFLGNSSSAHASTPHPAIPVGNTLLSVQNMKVWFTVQTNWMGKPVEYFRAVNDVSFDLRKGEVLGLVGESGCGKSTISRTLVGLLPFYEGTASFKGQDLVSLSPKQWNNVRRDIQMIFQDPFASLNPRMSIGNMLEEPLMVHNIVPRSERKKEVLRLLDLVQLPADSIKRYPHQFSGGQRQRLGIARALAVRPELLICDESVSALDVSVQAQVLNLLKDLQQEFNLSYLFISHDLNVVHYLSDRVMVMQSGKIVETGTADKVLKIPTDEYTKRLIAAIP